MVATDLSEFKSLVVETVKKLTAAPTLPGEPVVPGDADKLVFVDAEETDLEAAKAIITFFAARGIGALPPVQGTTPEAIRSALKTRMLDCDFLILVYGNNPDWPILQLTNFRKVKSERKAPVRAIGICDLPPPDKPMKATDVLNSPLVAPDHEASVVKCACGQIGHGFCARLSTRTAVSQIGKPAARPFRVSRH